jgi:nitroreductase
MDELIELIRTRRSIRKYKPDDVPDELIKKILEAGRWAPSGENAQPWRFIVVRDREHIRQMGEYAGWGSRRRFTAEFATGHMQHRFEGLKDPAEKEKAFRKLISGDVSRFMIGAPVVIVVCAKLAVWDVPYDCFAAIENMLLMAHSLGLGTCVVVAPVSDMRDDEKMMELLKVPTGYKIITPIAIGYPNEVHGLRRRLPLEEITYYEEFGSRKA